MHLSLGFATVLLNTARIFPLQIEEFSAILDFQSFLAELQFIIILRGYKYGSH